MRDKKSSRENGSGNISDSFPIVAIGASAGGLEAIRELLENLPSETGMAYIYVQHLDPTHESRLPSLLGKMTKMKVLQATHELLIEKNKVYIIPPGKDMAVSDGKIVLNSRKAKPAINLPIDKFFSSIAERQRASSIGIVLSGSASDGTVGLKAIKLAGGLTFAQDETAKFQSMPNSAIAEGVVDQILPPRKIAEELVRISKQSSNIKYEADELSNESTLPKDEDVVEIIQLLKKSMGVDFSHYKANTIKRRIVRRMLLNKLETLKDYYGYLSLYTNEINLLYQDLLIHVTSFFRDPDSIEYFKKTILPKILKSKAEGEPLRIWVPACSTGEEAYSLAMAIIEALGEKTSAFSVQIFATDLSEMAISKARLGLYSKNEVIDISASRLLRFFTKIDGGYRIAKIVRDLCILAPHNIFADPPFSKLDFISCCNLMIYVDTMSQKRLITIFHYALRSNGYLMLGKSETVSASPQYFSQVEKEFKIYSRKTESNKVVHLDVNNRGVTAAHVESSPVRKYAQREHVNELNLEKAVEAVLLAQYTPPSVVVSSDLEILQFRGSTGLFLEPVPGKASLNLLKMARPGLASEIRRAVHKAGKTEKPVKRQGLEITRNGKKHTISLEVVPIRPNGDESFFLILFEEMKENIQPVIKPSITKDKLVKKLEAELRSAKEDMRSIIAEQEATNEELQSANEEVISSHEELQSINEELETSKEEIESNSEELMTINNELQVRNDQLTESYEYAEAIFDIIREAVLVLDRDFRVKYANKAFYRTFAVDELETEGLFVYELGNRQWDIPQLRSLMDDVVRNDASFHDFEVRHTFRKLGEKVVLLHARSLHQKSHKQQLILLAINDITEYRQAQRIISERESWLRNITNKLPVMVWVIDADKKYTFLNDTWSEFTGRQPDEAFSVDWSAIVHPEDLEKFQQTFDEGFQQEKPYTFECRLKGADSEYQGFFLSASPNYSKDDKFLGFIGSIINIQNHRMFVDKLEHNVQQRTNALQEANKNLEQSNEELRQFAYVASHDLQEPLRKIMTFANLVMQRYEENDIKDMHVYLRKIVDSSKRMSKLINELLNFSRSARNSHEFSKVDLNEVVHDILKDFDLSAHKNKVNIEIEKLTIIDAIPIQMVQLFHNLISNAIKFSAFNANPTIIVSCKKVKKEEIPSSLDHNRRYIEISISDNGIGFNQQFADQIFVIFQRLHDKQTFPGTGIGLALCKKIVSNHDGLIYADSVPGEGATFHVILPIKQNAPAAV